MPDTKVQNEEFSLISISKKKETKKPSVPQEYTAENFSFHFNGPDTLKLFLNTSGKAASLTIRYFITLNVLSTFHPSGGFNSL